MTGKVILKFLCHSELLMSSLATYVIPNAVRNLKLLAVNAVYYAVNGFYG